MNEKVGLIVDNFAGGGGASSGIEIALGRPVDIAINHDLYAVAMHRINHPHTKHYIENIWEVDPREVVGGRPVGLVWLSPDCRHHSKAKGGKPVDKNIRGLAWVTLRWAATVKPRVIILENVEEFQMWGKLTKGADGKMRPDPKHVGREFKVFVNALRYQGYEVEWRELRACDYGAPTIRKRLFLVARLDGRPIVWPAVTHGDPRKLLIDGVKPWRTTAGIIDWSIPCPSIFASAQDIWEQHRVRAIRPLAETTMKRIAKGFKRFVIDNPVPFIVKVNHGGDAFRGQRTDEPLHTITAKHGYGLVAPTLIQYHGERLESDVRGQSLESPLLTADTSNRYGLVAAFLAKHYTGVIGADLRAPTPTITSVDHNALVTSHIVKLRGTNIGHETDSPLHTISAQGTHLGEVRAFLIKFYGNEKGGVSLDEPTHTITTKDRFGLVTVQIKGEPYGIIDIGMRMLQPHELFAAQGFPKDYIIDRGDFGEGEIRSLSKAAQVRLCGNSVCPPAAETLVRANLVEPVYGKKQIA